MRYVLFVISIEDSSKHYLRDWSVGLGWAAFSDRRSAKHLTADEARIEAHRINVSKFMHAPVCVEEVKDQPWPSRMLCWPCRQGGIDRRAVVRAFSGQGGYGGEGWPGCEEHRAWATDRAMETLADKGIDPTKWRVTVYDVVENEHGDPELRLSFTAQRRAP